MRRKTETHRVVDSKRRLLLKDWRDGVIIVDQDGEPYCYIGYLRDFHRGSLNRCLVSGASRDGVDPDARVFLRLSAGNIYAASFLNDYREFQVLEDVTLHLPCNTSSYFGAVSISTGDELAGLTQKLFGATIDELSEFLRAYSRAIGETQSPYVNYPRTTFSKQNDNRCDLVGCLIPRELPYVAFGGSEYLWGHVSLFGFYRYLSFACRGASYSGNPSALYGQLLANGAKKEVLDRLIKVSHSYGRPFYTPG
jgi:hypothetical protein